MEYVIFGFLIFMIYTVFLIWITVIHNKVNELVDGVNKIKEELKEQMIKSLKLKIENRKRTRKFLLKHLPLDSLLVKDED